jgi:hypothetical protein
MEPVQKIRSCADSLLRYTAKSPRDEAGIPPNPGVTLAPNDEDFVLMSGGTKTVHQLISVASDPPSIHSPVQEEPCHVADCTIMGLPARTRQ